jgi:hypothetical protein
MNYRFRCPIALSVFFNFVVVQFAASQESVFFGNLNSYD